MNFARATAQSDRNKRADDLSADERTNPNDET
jgi:hypothetical protein